MPTYTYKCKNCNHEFEKFQSIQVELLKICPACNSESLIRIIDGGAGLIFKGNGFYITDYKKSSSSSADGNGKASKPKEKTISQSSPNQKKQNN